MSPLMEVCIDSVQSAVHAESGGAARLELCANLMEGGTTPSLGMLRVIKQTVKIPVFVMLRPRGGDFMFSDEEFQVMKEDLQLMKENKADGIVTGILTADGFVDMARCQELVGLAKPLPVTFHRALDMSADLSVSLEQVIAVGCERVLTSRGENSALEGLPTLRKLVEQGGDRIKVMAGGGVTDRNIQRIIEGSGVNEFHATARSSVESGMTYRNTNLCMGGTLSVPEFAVKIADTRKIKAIIGRAKEFYSDML